MGIHMCTKGFILSVRVDFYKKTWHESCSCNGYFMIRIISPNDNPSVFMVVIILTGIIKGT